MGVSHFSVVSSTWSVLTKDASANVTLTAQEAADVGILVVSATDGDTDYVAFPAAIEGKVLIVYNADAATDVIVKVTGQTGVTIGETKHAILRCTATDFVRVTADA
jgi:hypothetical protein